MKTLTELAGRMLAIFSLFVAVLVACDNENPLDKFNPEDQFAEISDSLNNVFAVQTAAMRALIGDPEVALSYAVKRAEGDCMAALAGDIKFESYSADVEYYGLFACHVEGDAAYWALLDKEGNAEPLKDASDNLIPISEEVQVKMTSAGYRVIAAGKEFETVFTQEDKLQACACKFHTDKESRVYAVTFVLGPENEKTLYSRGYTGVGFLPTYGDAIDYISDIYVNLSSTSSVILEIPKGIEYTLEVTEGWIVVAREEDAVTYVDVTAEREPATSSALMVVSDETGIVLAELTLKHTPFRSLFASASDVFVDPYPGVRKFVYGVVEYDLFDTNNVIEVASSALAGNSTSNCVVAEEASKSSIAELLGGEVDQEKRYTLWAIPALYQGDEQDGYYYIDGASIQSHEFGAMAIDINLVEAKILDAQISVVAKDVDALYGGVVPDTEDAMDYILSLLQSETIVPLNATDRQVEYNGLMSEWTSVVGGKNEILPTSSYIVWAAPAFENDYPYSAEDVTVMKVTTGELTEGGSIELTLGTPSVTCNTVTSEIQAQGAHMVYYAILSRTQGNTFSGESTPNARKFQALMENSPVALFGETIKVEFLNPNTTYWLFAVAVDSDGKYGTVKCVSFKTVSVVFDETIALTASTVEVTSNRAVIKVTSDSDLSEYIYWVGRFRHSFWYNTDQCGATKSQGEKYMSMYPDNDNIRKAMNQYGSLSEDGTIVIDDLTMDMEYVFIILEKGETGYSHCGYVKFTTLPVNLGKVVKEGSEQWNATKGKMSIDWIPERFEQDMIWGQYAFKFNCPDTLTACVLCASDEYFDYAGFTKIEQQMIEIEKLTGKCYPVNTTPDVNGAQAQEPNYIKNGVEHVGQLMNVYEHYVHGVPSAGYVTYFAPGTHNEKGCPTWEKGQCTNYENYRQAIARYNTMTPWLQKASATYGLTGDEMQNYAQALFDAYSVYYKDAEPKVFENDGNGIIISNPYGSGVDSKGVIHDRVIVMFKDLKGNYYEPMYIEVPNYFKTE